MNIEAILDKLLLGGFILSSDSEIRQIMPNIIAVNVAMFFGYVFVFYGTSCLYNWEGKEEETGTTHIRVVPVLFILYIHPLVLR